MRSCLFVIAVAVAAACGATSQGQGANGANGANTAANGSGSGSGSGSNMICHEVTDTGSLMSHTECTPADEDEQQREDAQRRLQRTPNSSMGKSGH